MDFHIWLFVLNLFLFFIGFFFKSEYLFFFYSFFNDLEIFKFSNFHIDNFLSHIFLYKFNHSYFYEYVPGFTISCYPNLIHFQFLPEVFKKVIV